MATFKYIPVISGAQLVECLPTMHETLHGSPIANKLGIVMHAYNLRVWEMRAGGQKF